MEDNKKNNLALHFIPFLIEKTAMAVDIQRRVPPSRLQMDGNLRLETDLGEWDGPI